jgi:hypothetical protein
MVLSIDEKDNNEENTQDASDQPIDQIKPPLG